MKRRGFRGSRGGPRAKKKGATNVAKRSLYAMLAKKTIPTPSSWNLTPDQSPQLSPVSSEGEADHDSDMDADSTRGTRPMSMAIPSGAFCPIRPTLDDVLANTAPPPYTLSAFMAYLSQNHCLETLEFTMEAKRYGETYQAVSHQLSESPICSDCPQTEHLCMLWQRLISAYILPGSPREINLSSSVRDGLLEYADSTTPPPPEVLDSAVTRMHDLMEESIFIPFLNSSSSSAHIASQSCPSYMNPNECYRFSNPSLDDLTRVTTQGRRMSPRPSVLESASPRSPGSGHPHGRPSLNVVAALSKTGSRVPGHHSASSGDSGSTSLVEDSGSSNTSSPTAGEPMTPPMTPPSSDLSSGGTPKRTDNPWKKMGLKLGFKKRSGGSASHRENRMPGDE